MDPQRYIVIWLRRTSSTSGAYNVMCMLEKAIYYYYSLDVIISAGYRVKSVRGTQFRIWATARCEEFLLAHYSNLPRTTLRYAIERMEEGKRNFF